MTVAIDLAQLDALAIVVNPDTPAFDHRLRGLDQIFASHVVLSVVESTVNRLTHLVNTNLGRFVSSCAHVRGGCQSTNRAPASISSTATLIGPLIRVLPRS